MEYITIEEKRDFVTLWLLWEKKIPSHDLICTAVAVYWDIPKYGICENTGIGLEVIANEPKAGFMIAQPISDFKKYAAVLGGSIVSTLEPPTTKVAGFPAHPVDLLCKLSSTQQRSVCPRA
jgi:hypothetical protein